MGTTPRRGPGASIPLDVLTGDKTLGKGRYRVLRALGAGGMGVVYEAEDRDRDEAVALKSVRDSAPDLVRRLKREFRARFEVVHENLVSMRELYVGPREAFLTMDLVRGKNLRAHLKAKRGSDDHWDEVRRVFAALATGVAALHRAGLAHRDLKPANVLVDGKGRVVVVDFGLARGGPAANLTVSEDEIMGTPAYMAPEQAFGRSGTAASDVYAIGTMLYEVLTGDVPYDRTTSTTLLEGKRETEPRSPSQLVPDLPGDLVALCNSMLRREPRDRPSTERVIAGFRDEVGTSAPRRESSFMGRDAELRRLLMALNREAVEPIAVAIEGPSGIGKSALLDAFVASLDGPLVLRSRCLVRESVPYKAVDPIVEHLVAWMRRLPPGELDALLGEDARVLTRLFPSFGSLRPGSRSGQRVELGRQERRRRAYGALRTLLANVAHEHALVLVIDDLHWIDADSVELLTDLLRGPGAPALTLVMAMRDDAPAVDARALLRRFEESIRVEQLTLGGLARDDSVALARSLVDDDARARDVAERAKGSPFLLHELVLRAGPGTSPGRQSVEAALLAHVAELDETGRRLMAVVAVAGGPVRTAIAVAAAGAREAGESLVARLRQERLLRLVSSGGAEALDIYHDRIRETVARALDPEHHRDAHLGLARAMERAGFDEPEALSGHFEAAGSEPAAAEHAARAGERAMQALAFDHAASMFARAVRFSASDSAERSRCRERLGEALACAGRAVEAADAYLEATGGDGSPRDRSLRRRAGEQLLMAGHVARGLEVLDELFDALALSKARSPTGALLALKGRRAWIAMRGYGFRERSADEIPARDLERIDLCRSLALGLSAVDAVRGGDVQARNLLLALRAGEPHRVAQAIALEALLSAYAGSRELRRLDGLLQRVQGLLEGMEDPALSLTLELREAAMSGMLGRWPRAWAAADEAERLGAAAFEQAPWELANAQQYGLVALLNMGRYEELALKTRALLREYEVRGNRFASVMTRGFSALVCLTEDDVVTAAAEIDAARAEWVDPGFHIQHLPGITGHAQVLLYAGRPREAWRHMVDGWESLKRSFMLRGEILRVLARDVRARCGVAAWRVEGDTAARAMARRDARALLRERAPYAVGLGRLLRAGLAAVAEERTTAVADLDVALERFEEASMEAHVAASRRARAILLEDAIGVADAEERLAALGAHNPGVMARWLAPGFD